MGDSAHPSVNVFPGLRPFQPDETYLFFGRDGQSDELIRRLARYRFLAVVGSSGSGKSSLVRAGLLASLRSGFMSEAGSGWQIALFRPGVNPVASLAEALCARGALEFGGLDAEARLNLVETTLRRSSFGLVEATRQARLDPHQNLVVVVDQFEEIFRLKNVRAAAAIGEDEPTAFVKLLLEASNQTEVPIYIVITMRSDFIGDCSEFRGLPEILNRGMYLIPRMTRDQCRQAIEGPIAVGGATIGARLLQRLLNDVGDDPDQLPVLQHALMRTWENWIRRGTLSEPVDLPQYEAIGAMASALSRHADEAYEELDDSGRNIARILFQRLSEKGKDNRESRRPTKLSELCAVVDADEASVVAVIDTFRRDGRAFLAPPAREPLGPDSVIEISHESLIRLWDRLRHWADAEAESAVLYRRLTDTAVRHAAGDAALWQDPELQLALDWYAATQPNQAWAERYGGELNTALQFLELSRAQSARNERVRRAIYYSSIVAAVVFALLGVFAFRELLESRRLSTLNFARQLASQSEIIRNEEAGQTQLAALLAVEAARRAPIIETSTRLFDALHSLPLSRFSFPKPPAGTKVLGALSADGRYAAHLEGEVVTVYDLLHGKQVLELGDQFAVRALTLSPDGRFLGIARDTLVTVVEVSGNRSVWKHGVVSPVALALSERARFAAVSFESRVQVFDTQSDHELLYLPRSDEDAVTPPAGRRGSGRALPHERVVNEAPRFGRYGYKAIAFSADGRMFAAGGEDVDNAAYELQSGAKVFELSGTRHLTALAFGPDNDVVAAAGDEISVFDQSDGAVRARFRPQAPIVSLAVGPAGRYLAAASERSVQLFDVADGKRIESLAVDDSVRQVTLGASGQQLLIETGGRVLSFQDIAGGLIPLSDSADARPIALSPNARYLALVINRSRGMGECRVMDVATGRETAKFGLPSAILGGLAVSADGKYVAAVPNARAAVPIIDTATHLQRADSLVSGQYSAFAFSADGMSLAAAGENVASGKHETEILMGRRMDPTSVRPMIPGFLVSALAFSPEGGHLAAAGGKSIAVYDTSSRREIARINSDGDVRNVALTLGAEFVVAAGSRFGIYDIETGSEVVSLPMQSSPESVMALTADGRQVLIASPRAEGIFINHYPSQVQSLVDETCERLNRNLTSEEWERYLSPEPYRKTCINLP